MINGNAYDDSDIASPEHIPYVKAGFAVVGYDLDGPREAKTTAAAIKAAPSFMAVHGGIDNGKNAIDYVLKQIVSVDPERLYAAGHSSAAIVALDLIAADNRIKVCCAYAPRPDLHTQYKEKSIKALEKSIPGLGAFVVEASPVSHIDVLKEKPILLFTATDDDVVPTEEVQSFSAALNAAGAKQVSLIKVTKGGHYDSMISDGIPAGIKFIQQVDGKRKH